MNIPPAARRVADALVAVDEAIEDAIADPTWGDLDGEAVFLILLYGRNTAHTLTDLLALYSIDQDEEEICHQASL